MKLVINGCYGGFSISLDAVKHMAKAGSKRAKKELADYNAELKAFAYYKKHGKMPKGTDNERGFRAGMFDINVKYGTLPQFHGYGYVEGMEGGYERSDPLLVAAVEHLGSEKASGDCAKLKVVEVPDGIKWHISEYDGIEHIAEDHQTWA